MPTGYTADIANGITFPQFAMNCARAFGALITMRDEPADAEIPESFAPDTYHAKALAEARMKLDNLLTLSIEEADVRAHAEYVEEKKYHLRRLSEKKELRDKYEAMLAQAKAWVPPTTEHDGLKSFMVEQITSSIDFDCSTKFMEPPVRLTGSQWLTKEIAQAKHDIEYHAKGNRDEIERANGRTDWVRQLRESLKGAIAEEKP